MNLDFEKRYWDHNKLVAGIDEVGRGSLAGPVVSCCFVATKEHKAITAVNDSKKLNASKRNELYSLLTSDINVHYTLDFVNPQTIDAVNILKATMQSMNACIAKLNQQVDLLLVDGNHFENESTIQHKTFVKGDSIFYSIACASIIAKVSRDNYMIELAKKFPKYGFEKHKGYGTKSHFEAIRKYGISQHHRISFLKSILQQ